MNRQDAIKALVRAGKSRDVLELIQGKNDRAERIYNEIRADDSRTETHKNWQLAVACDQMRRQLDDEVAKMAAGVVTTDRDDAERVFGVKGLPGDPASLVISRRDAADRVSVIEGRDDLRALLTRATRSGDEVLARAVAERAVEMQDAKTMDLFLSARPNLEAAGERLWNAERAESGGMAITFQLSGLMPPELNTSSFDAVEGMAASAEPGTQAVAASGSQW